MGWLTVAFLAENVRRGLRAKARKGIWPTLAPFGYKNDIEEKCLVLDPEKAPIIKKIFDLYSTGRFTYQELADKINGLGLLPRRKGSVKFRQSNVEKYLKNPLYYGLVRWNGEDFIGKHKPIIPRDLFNRVQHVIKERSFNNRKGNPLKDYVFRGMFHCGECGTVITVETQKGHTYYRCTRKKGICFQPFIREELLMEQVRAEIEKIALPEDWAENIINEINSRKEELAQSCGRSAQTLKAEASQLDIQLDTLLNLYMNGETGKEEYHRRRSEIMGCKLDIEKKMKGFGRKGNDRLEPAIDFFNWSKEANKAVIHNDVRAQALALKKSSSNLCLFARKISLSVEPPFSFVTQEKASGNWGGWAYEIRTSLEEELLREAA